MLAGSMSNNQNSIGLVQFFPMTAFSNTFKQLRLFFSRRVTHVNRHHLLLVVVQGQHSLLNKFQVRVEPVPASQTSMSCKRVELLAHNGIEFRKTAPLQIVEMVIEVEK